MKSWLFIVALQTGAKCDWRNLGKENKCSYQSKENEKINKSLFQQLPKLLLPHSSYECECDVSSTIQWNNLAYAEKKSKHIYIFIKNWIIG